MLHTIMFVRCYVTKLPVSIKCAVERESRMLFLTASDVFSRVTSAAERAGKKKNLIYALDRKVLHVYIVGL